MASEIFIPLPLWPSTRLGSRSPAGSLWVKGSLWRSHFSPHPQILPGFVKLGSDLAHTLTPSWSFCPACPRLEGAHLPSHSPRCPRQVPPKAILWTVPQAWSFWERTGSLRLQIRTPHKHSSCSLGTYYVPGTSYTPSLVLTCTHPRGRYGGCPHLKGKKCEAP